MARSLLFDKIYRHHKVRALECMVAAILREITPLLDAPQAVVPLLLDDDDLMGLDEGRLRHMVAERNPPLDLTERRISTALTIAQWLRDRRCL